MASSQIPPDLKYSKDHEWVKIEGGTAVIGITDYAQGELGDIVFVDLPAAGKNIAAGGSLGTIEAVKAVSELYAPLSGTVTEVNAKLSSGSEVVNSDPYGAGWMVRLKLANPGEAAGLLDAAGYRKLIGQ